MRFRQLRATATIASLLLTSVLAATASAQVARQRHTTTLLPDGNVLVTGGTDAAGTALNSTDIIRATAPVVFIADTLNVARASHTATLLPDGRVLVTGGCTATPCVLTNTAEVYDPRSNAWTTQGNLGTARFNHTATLLPNGNVLIVGGQTAIAGTVTGSCEIFTPGSPGSFAACGPNLQLPRAGHTATLLHTGRVLIAGGYLSSGYAVSTELYDPTANSWASGPSLIQKRAFHTATQMGHQKVLITGGVNGRNIEENFGIMQTVEIYDPTSNTITPAQPMAARRSFHTAALLPSGEVAVFGGLANITTSYITASINLEPNSRLAITPIAGNDAIGIPTPIGSTMTLDMDGQSLSVDENGIIIDGEIFFSSPSVSGTFGITHFPWPDGNPAALTGTTRAPLTGRLVNHLTQNGLLQTVNVSGWSGTTTGIAVFSPTDVSPAETPAPSVRIGSASGFLIPGDVEASGTGSLTGGTLRVDNLVLPVPEDAVPGVSLLQGKAQILPGTSIDATTDSNRPFTIDLTTGSTASNTVFGTVSQNADGDNVISLNNLTFTGLQGVVNNSTDVIITAGQVQSVLNTAPTKLFSGGSIRLFFTFSPVDVGDLTFSVDVATIIIREMASGSFELYDPTEDEWEFGNAAVLPGFIGASSVLYSNQDITAYSGYTCVNEASCGTRSYSVVGGAVLGIHVEPHWGNGKALSRARSNHSSTELPDGTLLVAGGNNGTDVVGIAEIYDPTFSTDNDLWTDTKRMRLPRSHHTATLLPNGRVLIAGGFSTAAATGTTNMAEIYYPDTRTFVETAPMISSRSFHSAIMLPDGNVLVTGGFENGNYLNKAEIFYSTMHVWVPIATMNTARAQHAVSMLHDGRILVTGGVNATGVLGDAALGNEIYDPNTGIWTGTSVMSDPRHSHSATVLQDGRVLAVGGNDGFGEIRLGEIYDPTVPSWTKITAVGDGGDLVLPRLNHTATILPTNKVLITGGFTALGGPVGFAELFDPQASSFTVIGLMSAPRGDHTVSLLADGTLLAVGGSNGTQAMGTVETIPMGYVSDSQTPTTGVRRRPEILSSDIPRVQPGQRLTLNGSNFKGRGEAASGGTNSTSHHHPRLIAQRIGGSGIASSSDAGFALDLSSGVMHNQLVTWANSDSSMTVILPGTDDEFPMGWYSFRVAANGQYSDSKFIQITPPIPTASPGTPQGQRVGITSVAWTWDWAPGGGFDGYNVYSATNGVFIATVAPSGGTVESFVWRGLGPDTSALIKVAAYTLGGDGPLTFATSTVLTPPSEISNITGSAQTTQSIFWSWPAVNEAVSYEVLRTTSTEVIGTSPITNFTQTALSTNTAYGIRVRAIMPGGPGAISGSATTYTLAAPPLIGTPPVVSITTGGFSAVWNGDTNPPGTAYQFQYLEQFTASKVQLENTPNFDATLTGKNPNTAFDLEVQAFNGDGIATGFISLGTTITLAAVPVSPSVTNNSASAINLSWGANGNHEFTEYQVLYSSDNFVSHFATHTTFGSGALATTASIPNLITGQAYAFRVSAYDQFGRETAQVSTATVTDNGGGPPGSIAFPVPRTGLTVSGGTLGGSNRAVDFRFPSQTFNTDTQIFVSTEATLNCGNINAAINITPVPAIQPDSPFEMSIEYFAAEPNLGSLTTLGIARWDPASRTCVPLPSRVDPVTKRVIAQVNHLSQFQLMQLNAAGSISNSRVFPNPLYKSRQGFFTFDRLPANTRIRIFTITGGEVFDGFTNASGMARWDATNKAGRRVGSGLYIAVFEQGGTKKKIKLVVLR